MSGIHLDEEAIFDVARQISSAIGRQCYLTQVCGDRAALKARVEALLRIHDEEDEFLQSPPLDGRATVDAPGIIEQAGQQIGRYKLLQQIGEGGFGIVFMAEQQEPVRRRVALKVIKPGMDSKAVIARFEAERQALALMEHTNIAHVFDGGTTETGRPYFVMELVKGVSITEYCGRLPAATTSLSTTDRQFETKNSLRLTQRCAAKERSIRRSLPQEVAWHPGRCTRAASYRIGPDQIRSAEGD